MLIDQSRPPARGRGIETACEGLRGGNNDRRPPARGRGSKPARKKGIAAWSLQEQSTKGYVAPSNFAKVYIGLGDKDQAFAWLEKGYQQRDFWLTFLRGDPIFDSLRSDPRFQDLLHRIGPPQ